MMDGYTYTVKNQVIILFWKTLRPVKVCQAGLEKDREKILNYLLIDKFELEPNKGVSCALKRSLSQKFFSNFFRRYNKLPRVNRDFGKFEKANEEWLKEPFSFTFDEAVCNKPVKKAGRPPQSYDKACERTRRKRNTAVAQSISTDQLCEIAEKKFKIDGNRSSFKLMKELANHDTADNLLKASNSSKKIQAKKMSPEDALEMIVSTNLTTETYRQLRSRTKKHQHDVFPSLHQVRKAKQDILPHNMEIGTKRCRVPLQDLLDNTVKRLFRAQNLNFDGSTDKTLVLHVKYGFDGTTASRYKQKSEKESAVLDYLFCASLVPLKLVDKDTGEVHWLNDRPSSTRFCRPIDLDDEKETDILCRDKEESLKQEIDNLEDVLFAGCRVKFEMTLTMVDGKVCNALNQSSSQKCFVCKASISQLNDIDNLITLPVTNSALKYGFSILHANIRFMDLVFHVSYRMEMKVWRVPKEQKSIEAARKKQIQDGLYSTLGVIVDTPTQGAGNTNDGNTARKFFNNTDIVATVTGFDKELLDRFKVILAVISSGYTIDTEAFKEYAETTARKYVALYPWYYMPPSMHVILIHGYKIMQEILLPIGMMSEEAQEANNKNIKKFKDRYARKTSALATNQDMFERLMLFSDPYLSSLYPPKKMKTKLYTQEMLQLLIIESDGETDEESVEDSYEEEEETDEDIDESSNESEEEAIE